MNAAVDGSLDAVFALTRDGLCLIDASGRVRKASAAWLAMTNTTLDQLIGRDFWDVFPASHDELVAAFASARAGAIVDLSERARLLDGDTCTYVERCAPVQLPDGVGVLVSAIERKHAYDALRTSELSLRQIRDELSAVIEACKVPIVAVDLDAKVTFWSPAAERVFGWSVAEALGKLPVCIPPDASEEVETFRHAMHAGVAVDDYLAERCDRRGRRIPMRVSTALLRDASGRPSGLVIVLVDLAEQTSLRDASAESEHRFRATFEASPIANVLCRVPDRRVIEVNRACLQLFGRTRADFIGRAGTPTVTPFDIYERAWENIESGNRTDFEFT